jgi:hypothetical protein
MDKQIITYSNGILKSLHLDNIGESLTTNIFLKEFIFVAKVLIIHKKT